ncbi:hypothetical protein VE01_04084 [Pseudogymnoascus verrucosus]|uniref:Uncharacterized protein n=1 Tax=Pseudogymnoascus verrucosus TaxID=342668 RepID=A0A1B8GLW7_9PEZI|nr:uncharacterized protein VE01_04084 [Pseudogymnoascus verrucosus]OBT96832.1 hypothetical protein VE01_04084 [Pseudogymnoascus verrucosus]
MGPPNSSSSQGHAGSPAKSDSLVIQYSKRSLAYYKQFPVYDPGVFAPWDVKVDLKVHRLSNDLGVKVFVRVHTEQISENVGTAAPNFYTPSHHHVRTNAKVVGEGAPFVYNGKNTHTQKYTFPGKWGLKLKTRPPIEELVENEVFLAYMQRVAEGKYAIFTDEFCRKHPKIFLSITSPSTPGSIRSENPPAGPFFGVSPHLFPATAVQDADNLRTKMLSLEYTKDDEELDDEESQPAPQQPPPNFPPAAQQPPIFSQPP